MMMQKKEIVPPNNEIWYDADEQVTLYESTYVSSHTFSNGRGIVAFSGNEVRFWFRETPIRKVYMPDNVTSLIARAFSGCTSLTSARLSVNLTKTNNSSFGGCSSLELTSLPSSMTTIGTSCFSGCTLLALTSLPDGVTLINNQAFMNCTSLAITALPSAITEIGYRAFIGTNITSLTIPTVTPPTISNIATFPSGILFYVPAEAVDTYKSATNWSAYASRIFPIPE